VLYRMSEHNAARLDWYTDEQAYQTNPSIRKTLFIEEIKKTEQVSSDDVDIRQKYGPVGKSVDTLYSVCVLQLQNVASIHHPIILVLILC